MISGRGSRRYSRQGAQEASQTRQSMYWHGWWQGRTEISNHFWASPQVTTSMVTMILKYRYGQLWNIKIAFRQQRPYFPGLRIPRSDKCPHCGQADSGGHILGGCSVPAFKAMYIARHNQALRLVLKSHQLALVLLLCQLFQVPSTRGVASLYQPYFSALRA